MPLKTVVRCYFKTFGDFVTTYSIDVSRGGLFIATGQPVAEGEPLRLEFKLRNDYPLIMGEGEVVSVQNGGFIANFTKYDADSEKFLNEVVRVKAAEVQLNPADPKPVFEVKVTQEEVADDEFDALDPIAIEEIEEIEPTEATADPFGDDVFASPGEIDFSGAEEGGAEDPFADAPGGDFGEYEEIEAVTPPSVELTDEFEEVEHTPANPGGLFEDLPAEEAAPAAYAPVEEVEEIGESTAVFEKRSLLKERRALLIGVAIGVLVLGLGGGAYFFLGSEPSGVVAAPPQIPGPETVAQLQPAAQPATGAADAGPETAAVAAKATAVTLPEPVGDAAALAPDVEPALEPVEAASEPVPVEPAVAESKPAAVETKPAAAAAKPQSAPAPVKALSPAGNVTAIEAYDDRVVIIGDGAIDKIKYFSMRDPNRIVLDVYGVKKQFRGFNRPGKGQVARIRPGVHDAKLRFVLDLARERGKIPAYTIEKAGDRVIVRFQ